MTVEAEVAEVAASENEARTHVLTAAGMVAVDLAGRLAEPVDAVALADGCRAPNLDTAVARRRVDYDPHPVATLAVALVTSSRWTTPRWTKLAALALALADARPSHLPLVYALARADLLGRLDRNESGDLAALAALGLVHLTSAAGWRQ